MQRFGSVDLDQNAGYRSGRSSVDFNILIGSG